MNYLHKATGPECEKFCTLTIYVEDSGSCKSLRPLKFKSKVFSYWKPQQN